MTAPVPPEDQFLLGLRELTLKTGVSIGGCNCCGSPFLLQLKPEQMTDACGYASTRPRYESVTWVDPTDQYSWEHHAKDIMK